MARFILEETLNRTIDYPAVEEVLSVGYYCVIAFLAIFGNIFIIYATSKARARTVNAMTMILIKAMAITDLIGGLILYPNFILLLSKGYFPFNLTYCIVLGVCEIYFPLISTQLVMMLVVTKVAMIRNPFLSMKNPRLIYLVVIPMYFYGMVAPLGVFFDMGHYIFSPERGTCTYKFYPQGIKYKLFIMTCTTVYVIIPLCVIVCLSLYILKFVNEMRKKRKCIIEKDCKTDKVKDRVLKSVVVVLLVVIAYIVCWSMFFCVTTIAFLIGGEDEIPRQVLLWQKALLMTNYAVNPFVYVCGNKQLQSVLKHLFAKVSGATLDDLYLTLRYPSSLHDAENPFTLKGIGKISVALQGKKSGEHDADQTQPHGRSIRIATPVQSPYQIRRMTPNPSPTLSHSYNPRIALMRDTGNGGREVQLAEKPKSPVPRTGSDASATLQVRFNT